MPGILSLDGTENFMETHGGFIGHTPSDFHSTSRCSTSRSCDSNISITFRWCEFFRPKTEDGPTKWSPNLSSKKIETSPQTSINPTGWSPSYKLVATSLRSECISITCYNVLWKSMRYIYQYLESTTNQPTYPAVKLRWKLRSTPRHSAAPALPQSAGSLVGPWRRHRPRPAGHSLGVRPGPRAPGIGFQAERCHKPKLFLWKYHRNRNVKAKKLVWQTWRCADLKNTRENICGFNQPKNLLQGKKWDPSKNSNWHPWNFWQPEIPPVIRSAPGEAVQLHQQCLQATDARHSGALHRMGTGSDDHKHWRKRHSHTEKNMVPLWLVWWPHGM